MREWLDNPRLDERHRAVLLVIGLLVPEEEVTSSGIADLMALHVKRILIRLQNLIELGLIAYNAQRRTYTLTVEGKRLVLFLKEWCNGRFPYQPSTD